MRTASRAAKGPYPPLQKEMPASFRTRQSCASFVATAEDAMDEPITAHTFLSRYHGEACAMLVKRSKHAKTFRRIVPRVVNVSFSNPRVSATRRFPANRRTQQ